MASALKRMVNASTGKGRVSLITGAGSKYGLGAAMARVFAREGAKVVISDMKHREKEGLETVKQLDSIGGPGTAMWLAQDVTKEQEWKSTIEQIEAKFGPLDVLCNNAGLSGNAGPKGPPSLDKIDLAEYQHMMQVNEYAVVMGCKYGAESMSKNKAEEWKAIVNTSSIAGFFAMAGIPMPYVGTKFAVRGLTKSAAILGGPLNIRVNSIHPGAIESEMTHGVGWVSDLEKGGLTEGAAAMANGLPMKRFGKPEEVANVVLLLAGSEGTYITGQSYVIDVGIWLG